MLKRAARLIGALSLFFAVPVHAAPYGDWAAIVVAGDHEDSDGNPTQGFDNARRDVAHALLRLGFAPQNLAQFSTQPRQYKTEKLLATNPDAILDTLESLTRKTHAGCLLYFTSHGEGDGVIVGDYLLSPHALGDVVNHVCAARPTVVILSACFSGVMLPALKGPNRMILTAARRDRTSFGCGQSDRYPYFDQCVLESWGGASGFPDLADKTRACIDTREKAEHLKPPSKPQLWIGPRALASLPAWR
jgi:Peptidase C13 family